MKKYLFLLLFVQSTFCFALGPKPETVEQTFSMIKPEAVREGHIGDIIALIEKQKLRIAALKMTKLSENDAQSFYGEHKDKPFFNDLVKMITSGPIVVMVVEGQDAINRLRTLVGETNPEKAIIGTIRKLFGKNIQDNAIHASDSASAAVSEIPFFFNSREIFG